MMAPARDLVLGLCILLAVPFGYAADALAGTTAALVTVLVVGVVIPQLYSRIAVPSDTDR
jgi:hypothetical protein